MPRVPPAGVTPELRPEPLQEPKRTVRLSPGERLGAMTQRMLAGLLAVPLLGVLWFGALREPLPYVIYCPGSPLTSSAPPRRHRDHHRRRRRDLPRGRAAPVHHRLRHPGGVRRQPLPAPRGLGRPGRRDLSARHHLRAGRDRRVAGGRGRLPDGDVAGHRGRGGAHGAGVRRALAPGGLSGAAGLARRRAARGRRRAARDQRHPRGHHRGGRPGRRRDAGRRARRARGEARRGASHVLDHTRGDRRPAADSGSRCASPTTSRST